MFRFTIRDVLWLTALAATGIAWWADRSQLAWRATKAESLHSDYVKMLNTLNGNWRTISVQTDQGITPIAPDSIRNR
jgi:hypothetical protein